VPGISPDYVPRRLLISPVATSLLILASAVALLVFWFRQTCTLLLRNRPPLESHENLLETGSRPIRILRLALRERLAGSGDFEARLQELEGDFGALRYLLRRTSSGRLSAYSHGERMLIFDFRLTRAWLRLRSALRGGNGRGCERLHDILDYFTAVLQQRLRAAAESFQPLAAYAAAGATQLTVCSYCWRVRQPEGPAAGSWVAARRFHQTGGAEARPLSHGICPDCFEHLVRPTLPRRASP